MGARDILLEGNAGGGDVQVVDILKNRKEMEDSQKAGAYGVECDVEHDVELVLGLWWGGSQGRGRGTEIRFQVAFCQDSSRDLIGPGTCRC